MEPKVKPEGSSSITLTAPVVGTAPAFDTINA
jgi:hypothetical protein